MCMVHCSPNIFSTGEMDMSEVHPYISEGFGEDFVPKTMI